MTGHVYVTGTDTGIGKTLVCASLLAALGARGMRGIGMKPVASGCVETPEGLRNEDALALIAHSSVAAPYAQVNPYALREPIAPHIAAEMAGVEIRLDPLHAAFDALCTNSNCVIVEGVGGWCAPLSGTLAQGDVAVALRLPVILVVGLRLGCLNHAILSARAILADGCRLLGWIGNRIDPEMRYVDENLATLRERLPAPCLGVLPHASARDPHALAIHLSNAATVIASGAYPPGP
jgi:dethiobiotin synthetase